MHEPSVAFFLCPAAVLRGRRSPCSQTPSLGSILHVASCRAIMSLFAASMAYVNLSAFQKSIHPPTAASAVSCCHLCHKPDGLSASLSEYHRSYSPVPAFSALPHSHPHFIQGFFFLYYFPPLLYFTWFRVKMIFIVYFLSVS